MHIDSIVSSTLKEKCFRVEATPMDEEVNKYLAELPGLRFTPDQSCQQQFGPNSFYCSVSEFHTQNNAFTKIQFYISQFKMQKGALAHLEICGELFCFNSKDNNCYSYADGSGLEGTSCGNRSWCLDKQCVYDDRAPVREGI